MKSETTEKHKKLSSNDIACGVITLSDSITTDKDDLSGQYLADEISKRYTLKSKTIIPDDKESLIKTIKEMINKVNNQFFDFDKTKVVIPMTAKSFQVKKPKNLLASVASNLFNTK